MGVNTVDAWCGSFGFGRLVWIILHLLVPLPRMDPEAQKMGLPRRAFRIGLKFVEVYEIK